MAEPDFKSAREQIDAVVAATTGARLCPACGKKIYLRTGRISGKSWFVHELKADCPFDDPEMCIKFPTREEGLKAEKIYEDP